MSTDWSQIFGKTFWCFCEGVFWIRFTFKSADKVKQIALHNVSGPHLSVGSLSQIKSWYLHWRGNSVSSLIGYHLQYWIFLVTSRLPSNSDFNSFLSLKSAGIHYQKWDLPSLHSHISQFFKIPPSLSRSLSLSLSIYIYIYIYIYVYIFMYVFQFKYLYFYWFFFSGETWLIQIVSFLSCAFPANYYYIFHFWEFSETIAQRNHH
jgi:hypothetical protein